MEAIQKDNPQDPAAVGWPCQNQTIFLLRHHQLSPTHDNLQASWICLSPIARWIQAVYPATVGIGEGNLTGKGLGDVGDA